MRERFFLRRHISILSSSNRSFIKWMEIIHEPKMTFDKKRGVMRCGQAVIKNSPKKKYSKKISLSSI
jgi:hypothetical protein